MPVPPVAQQLAIVYFLDRETAEIDAFIADQERLIELLVERRSAAIDGAIGSASGPRVQLRRLGVVGESGTSVNGWNEPAESCEVGVLKTGAASKGYFDPAENKRVADFDLDRVTCPLRQGNLLVNRANTPDLVGSTAYVAHAPGNLYLSDKLWQVEFARASARFVHYWTRTREYRDQLRALSVGASQSMQNLAYGDFLSLLIPMPSAPEQDNIVGHLDALSIDMDISIADVRRAIALSRERRAALITAAVTGQIDVTTCRSRIVTGDCETGSITDREGGT
jgi:type I restriction enzyme S subunit